MRLGLRPQAAWKPSHSVLASRHLAFSGEDPDLPLSLNVGNWDFITVPGLIAHFSSLGIVTLEIQIEDLRA